MMSPDLSEREFLMLGSLVTYQMLLLGHEMLATSRPALGCLVPEIGLEAPLNLLLQFNIEY